MFNKNFDYVDKKFKVNENFNVLCCGKIFKPGEILIVWKHPTPNRLYVNTENGWSHNVKRSTFNRCCELMEE